MFTLTAKEPITVTVAEGATVTLAPHHPRIVAAGRAAVAQALEDEPGVSAYELSVHFSFGVLRAAITDWDGFGDADGEPLPCNPDTVLVALEDDTFFEKLDRAYVNPLNQRELEKNVLAASPDGTSDPATAENTTASTPATSESTPEKDG